MSLQRVAVTRYVTPLREGGSLPGIVEGNDLGTYVCKFRGAGQGIKVLVAEVIVAGLAETLGLATPRLVELELSADIARYEADEEVQDLLTASVGSNLGVDFLPGSFGFDTTTIVDAQTKAKVRWLDGFVGNVDRTWRNPNLLWWSTPATPGRLWLIDHGASLIFHHGWGDQAGSPKRFAASAYDARQHVFEHADAAVVDAECAALLSDEALAAAVARVPASWTDHHAAYVEHLVARRDGERPWL